MFLYILSAISELESIYCTWALQEFFFPVHRSSSIEPLQLQEVHAGGVSMCLWYEAAGAHASERAQRELERFVPFIWNCLYMCRHSNCWVESRQGLLQLQDWVSTKWSPINSFFSSLILIFHQYSVSKIHFYHTILQDSIRRHPGLEV